MSYNIIGYALIQLPDLVWMVYVYLKKVIRRNAISISDVPSGIEQTQSELASVSFTDDNFYTSVDTTHRFHEMAQRMLKTDEKLSRIEEILTNVTKSLDKLHAE